MFSTISPIEIVSVVILLAWVLLWKASDGIRLFYKLMTRTIGLFGFHLPEYLPRQIRQDESLGRIRFYVYVLHTDFGHYVGHTSNYTKRLNVHMSNNVYSTAGSNPNLLWLSPMFPTRNQAVIFEAKLKTWRDRSPQKYLDATGHSPVKFRKPWFRK